MGFKEGLRVFKNYQNSFKGVLKCYRCMDLITAIQAEGGLVFVVVIVVEGDV